MSKSEPKEKPACAVPTPILTEIECPKCGAANEIWSDDEEVTCSNCKSVVKKDPGSFSR